MASQSQVALEPVPEQLKEQLPRIKERLRADVVALPVFGDRQVRRYTKEIKDAAVAVLRMTREGGKLTGLDEELGVDFSTLYNWEKDRRRKSIETLLRPYLQDAVQEEEEGLSETELEARLRELEKQEQQALKDASEKKPQAVAKPLPAPVNAEAAPATDAALEAAQSDLVGKLTMNHRRVLEMLMQATPPSEEVTVQLVRTPGGLRILHAGKELPLS